MPCPKAGCLASPARESRCGVRPGSSAHEHTALRGRVSIGDRESQGQDHSEETPARRPAAKRVPGQTAGVRTVEGVGGSRPGER